MSAQVTLIDRTLAALATMLVLSGCVFNPSLEHSLRDTGSPRDAGSSRETGSSRDTGSRDMHSDAPHGTLSSLLDGLASQLSLQSDLKSKLAFDPPSAERLPPMLPPVPISLTPEVNRELARYLNRHRVGLGETFDRREQYLPMMEAIFTDEGLPLELLALPIIESAFNPQARSPVGARGLWQFMPATARAYGLQVDKRVDERIDPVLSTIAAAKFLRDLYEQHEDWHLALAAYNAGPGGIARAMLRTQSKNYWQLARAKRGITAQTQQFVPKFIAAAVIARRWNRYDAVELAANPELLLVGMLSEGLGPDA